MRIIIAQTLGVLGIIVFLFCFHGKEMTQVRNVKMLVDIIWGTHYFLLGAWSGFLINVICFFREIVFINSDKKFFFGKDLAVYFYRRKSRLRGTHVAELIQPAPCDNGVHRNIFILAEECQTCARTRADKQCAYVHLRHFCRLVHGTCRRDAGIYISDYCNNAKHEENSEPAE